MDHGRRAAHKSGSVLHVVVRVLRPNMTLTVRLTHTLTYARYRDHGNPDAHLAYGCIGICDRDHAQSPIHLPLLPRRHPVRKSS